MTVFQAIVSLTRASWQVLRRYPRLCWFPMLSLAGMIALFIIVGPIFSGGDDNEVPWLALFVVGTAAHVVQTFFAVGLTHEALKALRGDAPSVLTGVDAAVCRLPAVLVFAAITGPIGFLFGLMAQSSKLAFRLMRTVLGTAWSLMTYLAIPVMVQERRGGIPSLKRSGELFRRTWGETALSEVGVRVIAAHITLVLIILAIILVHLFGESAFTLLLVFALAACLIGVIASLEAIYRAALYVFAAEGVVPEPFGGPELEDIWQVR